MEIKTNPTGIDEGGRYRVYEWYDGKWNGSGTSGPWNQKVNAIWSVDLQHREHPRDRICVVDRLGNIVYEVGFSEDYVAGYRQGAIDVLAQLNHLVYWPVNDLGDLDKLKRKLGELMTLFAPYIQE